MGTSIKRQILAQLGRIGLDFEYAHLKVVPQSLGASVFGGKAIGQSFYVDLPNNQHHLGGHNHNSIAQSMNKVVWLMNI